MKINQSSLFALILLLSILIFSQCTIAKNQQNFNIAQFGFNPDGSTDNTKAFEKLGEWLEGKSDIDINFPPGIYRVGKQENTRQSYLDAGNILKIKNCSRVKLDFQGATLKYNNNLKYGSFDPVTNKIYNPGKNRFIKTSHRAQLGNCILIVQSSEIEINNVVLDGNIDNVIIGGNWGNKGIQLSYNGIKVRNSTKITLNKMTSKNFGLDGFNINNKNFASNNEIKLINCIASYNGRQGLSWVGGNGLFISGSTFEHTGQGKIRSSPCAGIDIEPLKGLYAKNGTFIDCIFTNSSGPELLFGSSKSDKIVCKNSTFTSSGNITIWPRGGGLILDSCTINGPLGSLNTTNPKKIEFNNCIITDKIYQNKNFKKKFLIDAGGSGNNVTFDGCTFKCYQKPLIYIVPKIKNGTPLIFKNNKIELYHKNSMARLGVFQGGTYQNNTILDYTSNSVEIGTIHFGKSKEKIKKGENLRVKKTIR